MYLKNNLDIYADDSTLYTAGKRVEDLENNLAEDLDQLSVWCNMNRMLVNTSKTKSMVITSHQKRAHLNKTNMDLKLNNKLLTQHGTDDTS